MSDPLSAIPTMRITPPSGLASGTSFTGLSPSGASSLAASAAAGRDFGAALRSAVESVVDTGREAETQSMRAITRGGNVTEVATALSRAELTLQTATAVRDRMLQAYQEIMRIQI